jgi:hypothetical protein
LRLRQEQEADYQRALAADRAKLTERRRVESLRADEERRLRDEAEREADRSRVRILGGIAKLVIDVGAEAGAEEVRDRCCNASGAG